MEPIQKRFIVSVGLYRILQERVTAHGCCSFCGKGSAGRRLRETEISLAETKAILAIVKTNNSKPKAAVVFEKISQCQPRGEGK